MNEQFPIPNTPQFNTSSRFVNISAETRLIWSRARKKIVPGARIRPILDQIDCDQCSFFLFLSYFVVRRVSPILFYQLSAIEEPEGGHNGCLAVLLVLPFGFLCHICIVAFFSISALSAALCCTLASCLHDSGYFWNLLFFYTNRFSAYTKPVNPLTETTLETAFQTRGEGGAPYDGLYEEAPPERGLFFRFQV